MDLFAVRIIFLASSLWGVFTVEITNMVVPTYVENGTQEFVLLDCEYEYDEHDVKLIVKWFHDNDPKPVYQWIPEMNTIYTSEKFGDRISKEYDIETGDNLTMFRALHMEKPTTEMSGNYRCEVTSMQNTRFKEASMTIYALPKSVSVNITIVEDIAIVMCIVEGVFPVPDIEMFHIEPDEMEPEPVEDVHLEFETDDDAYDVFLTTNMSKSELETGAHMFGCTVTLEGTTYLQTERIPFLISHGSRPGLRRKIHSDDSSFLHGNDPEASHTDYFNIANPGGSEPFPGPNPEEIDDNDEAYSFRPSAAIVLLLTSFLLVLCW